MQMTGIKNFFSVTLPKTIKRKSAGFYVSMSAAIIAFAASITYAVGYATSIYFTWWVFVSAFFAFVTFFALCWHRYTVPYAPVACGVLSLTALLVFIRRTYVYLSEVFYGGITAEAMKNVDPIFIVCMVFFLICVILSVVGICLRQEKKSVKGGKNE